MRSAQSWIALLVVDAEVALESMRLSACAGRASVRAGVGVPDRGVHEVEA